MEIPTVRAADSAAPRPSLVAHKPFAVRPPPLGCTIAIYMTMHGHETMKSIAAADSVRDQVALATLASLTRMAGGGFVVTSSAVEEEVGTPSNVVASQWREELMKISYKSVSFTNNGLNSRGEIDGKPHDVEVRAALMLYHRVRRGYCSYGKKRRVGDIEVKSKTIQKVNKDCSHALQVSGYIQTLDDRRGKDDEEYDTSIDIISDLGTRRKINSILSLANLLAIELERELAGNTQTYRDLNASVDEKMYYQQPNKAQPTTFTDIRSNDSGIICLLTLYRSKQLYSHGRIPCPNCTNWFKGSKGLWWHQLSVHGNQYSSAIEVAAGITNSLAIVQYQEQNETVVARTDIGTSDENVGAFCKDEANAENEAFAMVKSGQYDEFTKFVEVKNCTLVTQLDRNGASLLHWAAGCGRLDFVSYLIEQCNCCPSQPQRGKKSFMGRTPLHWAARNDHLSIVKYLVSECKVNIDAKTSDGTTALCWASWQGHLDIMKYLFECGADIHSSNKFGCNALLWSAQGACSIDIMTWLLESGLEYNLINTNGHSAFHKAAQRGNAAAVQWLANKFLSGRTFCQVFIGPDIEGNCPSDLCGMEGHENLAAWISGKECDCIIQMTENSTSVEDLLENHSSNIPAWLVQDLLKIVPRKPNDINSFCTSWGSGWGVRRMSIILMKHFVTPPTAQNNQQQATELVSQLNDLD